MDVFHHFVGVDDGLGFEEQSRGGDASQRIEGLDQEVCFRQVLAGRAQALPDEGDGVQPEHFHANVGEE